MLSLRQFEPDDLRRPARGQPSRAEGSFCTLRLKERRVMRMDVFQVMQLLDFCLTLVLLGIMIQSKMK